MHLKFYGRAKMVKYVPKKSTIDIFILIQRCWIDVSGVFGTPDIDYSILPFHLSLSFPPLHARELGEIIIRLTIKLFFPNILCLPLIEFCTLDVPGVFGTTNPRC